MKKFFGFVVVVSLIIILARACFPGKTEKESSVEGMGIIGQDPHAFADAEDMYDFRKADRVSKEDAEGIMEELAAMIDAGMLPEERECTELLHKLEGARNPEPVIEKLDDIAMTASNLIGAPGAGSGEVTNKFKAANELYEDKEYGRAVDAYTDLLLEHRNHIDARNNLGLAEMHMGNNLTAYLHFRIVAETVPKYHGASMNASVALERMGLSDKAYEAAKELVEDSDKLPMAYYNLGWLENSRGNFDDAESSYKKAIELYPDYAKAKQVDAMNAAENGQKLGNNELKSFNGDRAVKLSGRNQVIAEVLNDTGVMDGDEKIASADKGERYLVARTEGDFAAIYVPVDGVKNLGWVLKSDLKISGGLFLWWWWWLIAIVILYIVNMSRAAKNYKDASLGWGFLSGVIVLVFGIMYGAWWSAAVGLGWTFAALATFNWLILCKTSSY